jgi:hypothetical protein
MFTALVLASILTSFACGLWLRWRLVRDPKVFDEVPGSQAEYPSRAPGISVASASGARRTAT